MSGSLVIQIGVFSNNGCSRYLWEWLRHHSTWPSVPGLLGIHSIHGMMRWSLHLTTGRPRPLTSPSWPYQVRGRAADPAFGAPPSSDQTLAPLDTASLVDGARLLAITHEETP